MPNILLLIVVLANIVFMGVYIGNNGLGLFLTTTGIVFLVLGIGIFIFFLSIDPGYGWTKSIDFTKNYIMIFASMAVCLAGIVLLVTGQHINELNVVSVFEKNRCQGLVAGKAVEILKKDWYSLRDRQDKDLYTAYLFQKKSDRNKYKIIVTIHPSAASYTAGSLKISSQSTSLNVADTIQNSVCSGVFEKNISIDFDKHQELKEEVQFDVLLSLSRNQEPGSSPSESEENIQVQLENRPTETGQNSEENAERGTQVNKRDHEFKTTGRGVPYRPMESRIVWM